MANRPVSQLDPFDGDMTVSIMAVIDPAKPDPSDRARKITGAQLIAAIRQLATGGTFTQETRPTQPGPWTWWQTDADGNVIDLIVNDGA